MKHQQVVIDYFQMFKTSLSCIVLVFFVWIFIKLVQTIFLLPRYLQRNHDMIAKSLERHSITDEDLKAFEEDEQQNNNENQTENQSESIEELKKLN